MPDETATPVESRAFSIEFPGNTARAVFAGRGRDPAALVSDIGQETNRPVFLVIGGADSLDPLVADPLERLFEWGLVPAAGRLGATLMDGGTNSGVIAALGQASAASFVIAPLVGVAPAGRVTFPGDDTGRPAGLTPLEPNHGAFVLANSARWGGETPLLFALAEAVAGSKPIIAILAGGGAAALEEVRFAVSRRVPIVVIEGTGGVADQLRLAVRNPNGVDEEDRDAGLTADADLTFFNLEAEPADLERVMGRFMRPDETLREMWRLQRIASEAAAEQQHDSHEGQDLILILGLVVTTLVVVYSVLDDYAILAAAPTQVRSAMYVLIVLLPIVATALTAAQRRFRPENRWVLLRGTSETLKSEIFRYRARAGVYSPAKTRTTPRGVKLSEVLRSVMGGLMRTEASQLALEGRQSGPIPDDRLTTLTAEGYVNERLNNQLEYYTKRAAALARRARRYRLLAIAFGGVGSFLAAVGLQIWVAITTALVGIFTTLVESRQLEATAQVYNQAAADLTAIRAWWYALPEPDHETQATLDRLVDRAEQIIRAEHIDWTVEMQKSMTQFRTEQAIEETAATETVGERQGG